MKKILSLSLIAIILIFSGCSSKKDVMVSEGIKQYNVLKNAPEWVFSLKQEEGILSAVGSSGLNAGNDIQLQKSEAAANARDGISKMIKIKVSNMFKNFKSTSGVDDKGTYDKVTESVSKQISNETLVGSSVTKVWIAGDGTMFVKVELSSIVAKTSAKYAVKTSLKNEEALWQQFKSKNAHIELDEAINKNF